MPLIPYNARMKLPNAKSYESAYYFIAPKPLTLLVVLSAIPKKALLLCCKFVSANLGMAVSRFLILNVDRIRISFQRDFMHFL